MALGVLPFKEEYSVMDIARGYTRAYLGGSLSALHFSESYIDMMSWLSRTDTFPAVTEDKLVLRFYSVFLSLFKTLAFYKKYFPQYVGFSLYKYIFDITYTFNDFFFASKIRSQLSLQEENPFLVSYLLKYYHTNSDTSFLDVSEEYDFIVEQSRVKIFDAIKHKEYNDLSNLLND